MIGLTATSIGDIAEGSMDVDARGVDNIRSTEPRIQRQWRMREEGTMIRGKERASNVKGYVVLSAQRE